MAQKRTENDGEVGVWSTFPPPLMEVLDQINQFRSAKDVAPSRVSVQKNAPM